MAFSLRFSEEASGQLANLEGDPKKLKKVRAALGRLQQNPRHPGLGSHKYKSMSGPNGEEVWDSYVENHTPSAWRIYWMYGPSKNTISIISISPHR